MDSLYDIATILHSAVVLLFVTVTGLLLVVSAIRRRRMRNVKLSWASGKLFGLPLTPTIFLIVVVGLIGLKLVTEDYTRSLSWVVLTGYLVGGMFWYIGAVLSTSVVVTDWGLSRRIRGKSDTLAWHDVTDYFTSDHARKSAYVFFRLDERGRKLRFDLEVPVTQRASFRDAVESKLDARFNYYVRRPAGSRTLKHRPL
ncbi:hypothetical protein ACFLRO_01470 [Bacteroidota bacterium]